MHGALCADRQLHKNTFDIVDTPDQLFELARLLGCRDTALQPDLTSLTERPDARVGVETSRRAYRDLDRNKAWKRDQEPASGEVTITLGPGSEVTGVTFVLVRAGREGAAP